jgi:hypothetical protein
LPTASDHLEGHVACGVGEVRVAVPANTSVTLDVNAGTGELDFDIADGAAVDLRIKGGVGETNILVPQGAAIRLEAHIGIGSVNLPGNLGRISGVGTDFVGKRGVWQTSGYDIADRKIVIRFDGGIGSLNIR